MKRYNAEAKFQNDNKTYKIVFTENPSGNLILYDDYIKGKELAFDSNIIAELSDELVRARAKFPSGYNLNFAAMEELGELVSAQMQNLSKDEIRKEAIQVMAMCVRIIEEGDKSLVITEETSQK